MGTFPYDFFWCHIIDFPTLRPAERALAAVSSIIPVNSATITLRPVAKNAGRDHQIRLRAVLQEKVIELEKRLLTME